MKQPTRRDVLKQLGIAGAGIALTPTVIRGQGADLMVGGQPVEIAVSSLSAATVRITLQAIAGGQPAAIPDDGTLVQGEWGKSIARARTGAPLASVKAGNLVVHVTADPLVIRIEGDDMRTVQEFKFDAAAPGFSFLLPRGPLLGLGEGGSQYDRKGATDRMPSGQATYMPNTPRGYRLATHGGRVPIQWMVGTDGWGLYIHQPLGAFDFTGDTGKFTPPAGPNAIDLFVVSSKDPAVIMREYARITGLPEIPALWTLGYLQSHRTLNGPDEVRWVAKTMREKKLPCDALIYLGTDFTPSGWNTHNGEFTWNPKNFPDPEGDDRRASRPTIQGRAPHRRRGRLRSPARNAERQRQRSVYGGTPPTWSHTRRPVAAGSPGQLLLARAQAALRPRHRRLVAGPGRRPRRPVKAGAYPDVLGRQSTVATERASVCAPPQRLSGHAAVRRVLVVGRCELAVGDAQDSRPGRRQHGTLRDPLVGDGYRRVHPDARIHGRVARALVPVRRVLSALPRARPRLAPPIAVGLEHGRAGPERSR